MISRQPYAIMYDWPKMKKIRYKLGTNDQHVDEKIMASNTIDGFQSIRPSHIRQLEPQDVLCAAQPGVRHILAIMSYRKDGAIHSAENSVETKA